MMRDVKLPRWSDLSAGIIGAGRSGLSAARFLRRLGARVLISDSGSSSISAARGVEVETGGHSDRLLNTDLIIRSPGVSGHLPILQRAIRRRIPIWSEIELAASITSPQQLIAITGTNGKTTTTALVGEIFKAGWKGGTFVGGNIGIPFADFAFRVKSSNAVVLEVSSYQLEDIHRFHPTVSAILNITPDHLEHHGTMAAYAAAKARVFENQNHRDVCVLNADDEWCRRLARRAKAKILFFSRHRRLETGIWMEGDDVVLQWGKHRRRWPLVWKLPGGHNIENGLAAIAISVAAGIPVPVVDRVFKRFNGVEHRLENVRDLHGVRYVNDSKATNVDSTRVALEAFDRPLLVIMGGRGKGSPYRPLAPLVRAHARRLILIGEDAPAIRRDLGKVVPCDGKGTMEKAVVHARRIAKSGEVVLLSPACASFDQYSNYEERGRHFKALVRALK